MGHRYAEIAFTPNVKALQTELGSRNGYARLESKQGDFNHRLTAREADFITARDSFYMATVSETGWPYVQHRGGRSGFVKVLDETAFAFADYSGNRQYLSTGNLAGNDRVSLFFMDYPGRTRLKVLGRASIVGKDEAPSIHPKLQDNGGSRIERWFVITVEAFDWNCPQFITPRYTHAELKSILSPLHEKISELERQLAEARV